MKLFLFFCLVAPNMILSSTGGNCENVCNYQIDNYWTPCLDDNCPQINGLCPTRNATTCVCSADCQMCVDDLYNECGGCTNKYGYDFNKDSGPKYKKLAEDMGCNNATRNIHIISLSILFCLFVSTALI